MAHAQKPDFVFRRNGRVYLNRQGASVQSTTGSRGVRINGSNDGYTMFRGSVKGTGYPLHSPVSPSLPLPCVTVCHHISTGLYHPRIFLLIFCMHFLFPHPTYICSAFIIRQKLSESQKKNTHYTGRLFHRRPEHRGYQGMSRRI